MCADVAWRRTRVQCALPPKSCFEVGKSVAGKPQSATETGTASLVEMHTTLSERMGRIQPHRLKWPWLSSAHTYRGQPIDVSAYAFSCKQIIANAQGLSLKSTVLEVGSTSGLRHRHDYGAPLAAWCTQRYLDILWTLTTSPPIMQV